MLLKYGNSVSDWALGSDDAILWLKWTWTRPASIFLFDTSLYHCIFTPWHVNRALSIKNRNHWPKTSTRRSNSDSNEICNFLAYKLIYSHTESVTFAYHNKIYFYKIYFNIIMKIQNKWEKETSKQKWKYFRIPRYSCPIFLYNKTVCVPVNVT